MLRKFVRSLAPDIIKVVGVALILGVMVFAWWATQGFSF